MSRRQQGFTLIELIISLVIVAIIMVGLLTALRSFGLTEEKLDGRLAQVDERRVVSGFLEDVLGMAVLRPRLALVGTPDESSFVGESSALQWIGVMPARNGTGGLYHFRLQPGPTADGGTGLILIYVPYTGLDSPPEWSVAEQRVLVPRLDGFTLAYQLDDDGNWLQGWRNTTEPRSLARIRIAVASAGSEWPFLVIPVRGLMPSGTSGRIVTGAV
jgi:general secretion pathway protein J